MATKTIKNAIPRGSKLDKLLAKCGFGHELHLHELNDGAISFLCYSCPFHHVLSLEEEEAVRNQMDEQHYH